MIMEFYAYGDITHGMIREKMIGFMGTSRIWFHFFNVATHVLIMSSSRLICSKELSSNIKISYMHFLVLLCICMLEFSAEIGEVSTCSSAP
ncbi:hypothetical protein SLEP1_g988 [Rubroshorea leprosula]|uniref:Uncharacterized protein n=1 Tax=Rubroshorea leprosula TaxID=152421 RepID=A0AAV5HN80_9ROSI|nr:hypothetical protein SLEP1_g988 [Rubroshorea leprosula]